VRVSGSCFHLEEARVDVEHRDVEGPSAEVVDEDVLFVLFVETVRNRCCGRFVDDAQDIQPRNDACVLGGLPLGVVEVGGDGDDGVGHFLAQLVFRNGFHLSQDHRGDFLGQVALVEQRDLNGRFAVLVDQFVREQFGVSRDMFVFELPADQTFGVENRVGRVERSLVFS